MANINASGAIKAKINNDNYTIYPITRIANVDGLQTALDGKAAVNHTHSAFSTTSAGFVPAASSSGDTDKYLKGDGTWATPSGGGGAVSGVKGNDESTYRTGNVNLTCDNIGASPNDHSHGSIGRNGDISNDVTIANNDKLLIKDYSDSNRIKTSSVSFDGSTNTQCLTKAGTWASFGTSNLELGTSSTTAAKGNHTHSGYASSSHTHSNYVVQAYYTSNKTSGSLNDLSEGRVYCSSNCTNLPVSANCMVETIVDYNGSYKTQKAEVMSGTYAGCLYTRYYTSGSWSTWINLTPPQLKSEELYFGLPGQSWTKSAAGMYYCAAKTATTLSEIYAATIDGWTGLKESDMVAVTIKGISSNQVSLIANVNIFSSGSWIKVKAFGV